MNTSTDMALMVDVKSFWNCLHKYSITDTMCKRRFFLSTYFYGNAAVAIFAAVSDPNPMTFFFDRIGKKPLRQRLVFWTLHSQSPQDTFEVFTPTGMTSGSE